ncbi:MAG TPA: ferrochelatase, partial [Actinomycetota bacterium]|nr:ferrochelatase [Actinomycetota bacterium]
MRTAVLLMAYGSPRTPDEIEPYFTDIRGGRPPSPQVLKVLADRYERIGGKSPLNEITREQAESLEELLEHEHPGDFAVFTGMKHWHPFVADSVAEIVDAGITRVIGLVLAPHFSKKSIGEYEARILKARDGLGADLRLTMVKSWYD